jgi:UDP-3-O-[3-hydroxymyristoyl] glucosamine N-acyltransferase
MSLTSGQIAELTGGELHGSADVVIRSVQLLDEAGPNDLAFIGDDKHAKKWSTSQAGAALIARKLDLADGPDQASIRVDDVDLALAIVLEQLAPQPVVPAEGVHPSAIVDPSAQIGRGCRIGPLCVIGPNVTLGDGCTLHDRVTIEADVTIGAGVDLRSGAVIGQRCEIADGSLLHPGAVIGADGFGYRPAPDGKGLVKIPQIGNVVIGRGVEIGANSCVDRAKFGSTVIGDGCKIDNLVQIGHNCRLGRCVIVAGQTGLAGSVSVGDGAIIGGACAIRDHLTIGPGATIAGGSQLMNDVPAGETWAGSPALLARDALRQAAAARQLPEVMKKVRKYLKDLDG